MSSSAPSSRVSIGLGGLSTIDDMLAAARAADDAGAYAVWLPDHVAAPVEPRTRFPYGDTALTFDPNMPFPDVWAMASYIAATTTHVRIGIGVLVAPLRHPLLVARAAATIQLLSAGRLLVGMGAGWLQDEFDALDVDFSRRGQRLDETIEICRSLWTGQAADHGGSEFSFDRVQLRPAPRVGPSIYIGGASPAALRRAARCDGWYAPACTLEEALDARRAIAKHRVGTMDELDLVMRPTSLHEGEIESLRAAGFRHLAAPLSMFEDRAPGGPAERVHELVAMMA